MLIRTTLLLASFATLPAILATSQSGTLSPSDHIEIQQLYARYNYVMDSTDAKMLPTVFTPDATLGPPDNRVRARDVLEGLVAKERPQVYRLTTNIIISASPEGARGTAYARYNYVMDSTDAKMLPTVFTPDATLGPPDRDPREHSRLKGRRQHP